MVLRLERAPYVRPLFADFNRLSQEMEALISDFLPATGTRLADFAPRVEVAEDPEETSIHVELPGVRKDDVKISFEKGELTISGERKESTLPENASWLRSEIPAGSFSRVIPIEHEVRTDAIAAEMKDGLLTVTLPKAEAAQARGISIR
jgi:HSP20 family protein